VANKFEGLGLMATNIAELAHTPVHEKYRFKSLKGSSHHWALSQMKGRLSASRVLDVGAGGGGLGKCVRDEGPRTLIAVEPDLRAHDALGKIYDSIHASLQPLSNERFDWILVMDVLEHTPSPEAFLAEIRELLAPGGRILVSVPNVAHWSVRLPLFFWGSFEYQPLGIMDRTHLHFFYKRSFRRLCSSLPHSRLVAESASIEPFELALPQWLGQSVLYRALIPLRLALARTFRGLFAYQLLAVIEGTSE
jgi:SAM-dependent methyltransferase